MNGYAFQKMSLDHSFSSMSLYDVVDKSFERSRDMKLDLPDNLQQEIAKQIISYGEKLLISNEILEPPITFDDGNQSPISDSNEYDLLRIEYVTYLTDYNPLNVSWMSDWSGVLFC